MKRIVFFLSIIMGCQLARVHSLFALTAPAYNQEKFYLIQFSNSKLYLTAGSNNANLTTQQATLESATDRQLWKFVGTQSGFQLVNKAGQ